MVQIVKNNDQTGVKSFVCDKKDELSEISLRTTLMGSTCFVIEDNDYYILDGNYKWVKKKMNGSSSGQNPSDNEYIMDGGEII